MVHLDCYSGPHLRVRSGPPFRHQTLLSTDPWAVLPLCELPPRVRGLHFETGEVVSHPALDRRCFRLSTPFSLRRNKTTGPCLNRRWSGPSRCRSDRDLLSHPVPKLRSVRVKEVPGPDVRPRALSLRSSG